MLITMVVLIYKNISQQLEYSCASLLRVHNHKFTRAKGFEERFSHRRYISTSLMHATVNVSYIVLAPVSYQVFIS